uniref:Apolipoprotein C-II n=1 Tax=Capra hircus TaxID=9925 RepID=A0A8C2RPC2_CAPHI
METPDLVPAAEDSRQSLCSRSPDAMGTRYFLVGFLILLVLGFEAQGAHVPQQDEASSPALLTKMQKSLLGYWDTAKAAAHKLYKKTYLPTVDEKIRYHLPPTHTPGARSPRPQPLFPQPQESRPPATHPSDTGSRPPAPPPSVRLSFLPRDIYSKSTAAVTTYAGIITDQVFSILSGED